MRASGELFCDFLEQQTQLIDTRDGRMGMMLRPFREFRLQPLHLRLEDAFYRQLWQGIALSALVALGVGVVAGVAFCGGSRHP